MKSLLEVWRPVVGFEATHKVSNTGRVVRVSTNEDKELSQHYDKHGYARVSLCANGVSKTCPVHRVVALAFLGPVPKGMWVLHGSKGVKCNNIDNLYFGSPTQNARDKIRDGTLAYGARNGRAKLTDKKVKQIKAELETGATVTELARKNKVSRRAIMLIRNNTNWRHLTQPPEVEEIFHELRLIRERLTQLEQRPAAPTTTWLTPAQMAARAGCSPRTLQDYVRSGRLSRASYKREPRGQGFTYRYHGELAARDLGLD